MFSSLADFNHTSGILALLLAGMLIGTTACDDLLDGPQDRPVMLENRADSVAFQLYEGLGGPEAWDQLPYLRFDFAVENPEGDVNTVARHYWDRQSDDYRVEWSPGEDTTYVALFNVQQHEDGQVYLNGEEVHDDNAELLESGYRRFINDSYWAIAPVKTFDEGVNREYVADSSDAQYEVIRLSFGDVGLTPGDQYWMYVNTETHRLDEWAFLLERMSEDDSPSHFEWLDYEQLSGPGGAVQVAVRKRGQGGQSILTPVYELSTEERENLLQEVEPQLE